MDHALVVYEERSSDGDVHWDVYSQRDVIGTFDVQQTVDVIYPQDGKAYKAKILCIGTKEYCEERSGKVSRDGRLLDIPFSMAPAKHSGTNVSDISAQAAVAVQSIAAKSQPKTTTEKLDYIIQQIASFNKRQDEFEKKLNEVIRVAQDAQNYSEAAVNTVQQMAVDHKKLTESVETIADVIKSINDKVPDLTHEQIDWTIMPLERVEYLKMDNPTCTRFALQLERLLFADSPEFCKVIEERYHSTEKVRFLRNCVKAYFSNNPQSWEQAKKAINKEARRRGQGTQAANVQKRGAERMPLEDVNCDTEMSESRTERTALPYETVDMEHHSPPHRQIVTNAPRIIAPPGQEHIRMVPFQPAKARNIIRAAGDSKQNVPGPSASQKPPFESMELDV